MKTFHEGSRLLDIGCGPDKQAGYIGVDIFPFTGVDVVRDTLRGLPFENSSVDGIFCKHFLEHVAGVDLIFVIEEFYRVSKPGAGWSIIVPDATSPNMHKDPTHVSLLVPESFDLWRVDEEGHYLIFVGPSYGRKAKLMLNGTEMNANRDRIYDLEAIKP